MRNQMKFYLALVAVILLQGSIFSISIKESESLKLNLETESKTGNPQIGDDHHDLTTDEAEACAEEIPTNNEVLCKNPPTDIATPIDPTGCRRSDQEVVHTWTKMYDCNRLFDDVGVSSEGAIVAIGVNGNLYLYDYKMNEFELVEGDFRLYNLRRVDIAYDGRIYVVNYSGDTYYLDCNRHWVKLPGCAIDIGAGRGSEIVKIGCNDYCGSIEETECIHDRSSNPCKIETESSYVYKLICDCDCRCCHRKCNIFVKYIFDNCEQCKKDVDRKCYWIKYPNGPCYKSGAKYKLCTFSRIDAHLSGNPMLIGECNTNQFKLWQFIQEDKNIFKEMVTSTYKFRDLCGDNLGNIFYIVERNTAGTSAYLKIYKFDDAINSDVIVANTQGFNPGFNLSCGPYAQPTATDKDCCLWTTTKVGYN